MFGKKNRLGMKEKPRPMAEIEAEYARLAGLAGHKARLGKELCEEAEAHLSEMSLLSKESVAASAAEKLASAKQEPAAPVADPVPAQQGST